MTGWSRALLGAHLVCALGAVVAFWTAAAAAKGGRAHRRAGAVFARLIYGASATGALLAVVALSSDIDTAERRTMFLALYVLVILVAPVQHGLAVVGAASAPRQAGTLFHGLLGGAAALGSAAFALAALTWREPTFLIVAALGCVIGLRQLRYVRLASATRDEWRREHLTSLILAGVVLHTVLVVFTLTRTLGWHPAGAVRLLPWLVPALAGLPVLLWCRRRVW